MSDYVKTRIVKDNQAVDETVYNIVDTKQPMIGSKGMFYRIQGTMNVPSGEATLYRVTDDQNNVFLAKHYRMKIKEETREKMLNFLTNLKKDSNVMPILDHGEYFNTPFDILPYYPDKDLSQKGPMDINFIKNIFLPSMNSALNEIHAAGIVHRDIKPENLFYIVDEQKVVIGDFGIASNLNTGSNFKSTEIGRGTVGYLAPEVKNNNVHIKTDYYALGVTIVCLVEGHYIFRDMDEPAIYKSISSNAFSNSIKDRRLRQLVRGLTIADINVRFDGREVDAYIYNKPFKVLPEVDSSREAKINKPYQFDNQAYFDVEALAQAMSQNWDSALEHLKRGLIERHFVDIDPDLYVAVQKILEEEHNIDCALTRVLYRFNPKIGICYKGHIFADFKAITDEMKKSYPEIDQDYRVFLDDGVLLNLAREKYRVSKSLDDEMLVKSLGNIQDIGNRDLAYFYFLLFGLDEMPPIYIGEQSFEDLDALGKYLLSVTNSTIVTRQMAQSPCILAYLACYVGIPTVVKIVSDLNMRPFFEVHLQILSALEQRTKMNFNRIAYMGFGRWLADNFTNYNYVGKEAKAIQKRIFEARLALKNAMGFKLQDFSKIIDQMEENVRDFIANFNYNIINKSVKKGIIAKRNEYYLAIEYEGELCCLEYKKYRTNIRDSLGDAQDILNNEIDKCMGLANRNINRINNIVERNSVLRRKREEESKTVKISNIRFLSYILIACLINSFAVLLYFKYVTVIDIPEISKYVNYSVYGIGILYDLFFLLTFFNCLHVHHFLKKEDKYYKRLEACRKDLNKTLEYFSKCQKEIKTVATNFLRNKQIFNPKFTRLDYSNTFNQCEQSLSKHQNLKLPSAKYNHFVARAMYFLSIGASTYYVMLFVLNLDLVKKYIEGPKALGIFVGLGVGWIVGFLITGINLYKLNKKKNKDNRRVGIFRYAIALIISCVLAFALVYVLTKFL